MAARVHGQFRWRAFPDRGFVRVGLRSFKRYRRWLQLDRITFCDQIFNPDDSIVFERSGFDWIQRRGWFGLWRSSGQDGVSTSDESVFDVPCRICEIDGFWLTIDVAGKRCSWLH